MYGVLNEDKDNPDHDYLSSLIPGLVRAAERDMPAQEQMLPFTIVMIEMLFSVCESEMDFNVALLFAAYLSCT